jgi:hypothetical protein
MDDKASAGTTAIAVAIDGECRGKSAGVAAVALPGMLGLLQIGSEFTKEGKEGLERGLQAGRRLRND